MSSAERPLVTVLMPVFNAERYLRKALQSIVDQSYRNLEILVIDDGSTDGSAGILKGFARADRRIQLISRSNKGLVATLNEGIEAATGRFIARMDADDVSAARRIERQVAYLIANPDVMVLGVRSYEHPLSPARWLIGKVHGKSHCTWSLLFTNYIGHPGVMLRRDVLLQHGLRYRREYEYVEDYKLWCEMTQYGWADVLNEPLLYYRRHPGAASRVHAQLQQSRDRKASAEMIRARLGIEVSDLLPAADRAWTEGLRTRIFSSERFRRLDATARRSVHFAYQDFAGKHGVAPWRYLRQVGLAAALQVPGFGLRYLYRYLKYLPRRLHRALMGRAPTAPPARGA